MSSTNDEFRAKTKIGQIALRAARIGALQERIKAAAMIYQRDLKERAAQWNGQRFDAYYDLPYRDWEVIRDQYLQEYDQSKGA